MNDEVDLDDQEAGIFEALDLDIELAQFPQCSRIDQRTARHDLSSDYPGGVFPQANIRWSQDGILNYRLERSEVRRVRSRGEVISISSTSWDLTHGKDAIDKISLKYKERVPPSEIESTAVELLKSTPRPPGDMFHKIEVRNRSNNYVAFELRLVEETGDVDVVRGAIRHRSKRNYYAFGNSDALDLQLRIAREDPR